MSEPSSLDALARRARDGGPRDVEAFLQALRPLVCRWSLAWTGHPDAAEDVAQRALCRVYDALGRYEARGNATAWAFQITRNLLIDHDRRRQRRQALSRQVRIEPLVRAAAPDASTGFEAAELIGVLMRDLSPQQRSAVDLVDLQGFSAVEAAGMLEVEPATVRVHLHRGRAALRARWEALHDTEAKSHD